MLTSLALVFLIGLCAASICRMLRLPGIVGMLISGIVLGPCVLDLFSPSLLGISADLRKMALVIILIKAGLSLNIHDLRQVGRPALLMSCLPASMEILAYVLFAPALLDISVMEAAVMGAVMAAVSPAVVVPRMVQLMEEGYGAAKQIPQMILAGASLDDVFVITLFTSFVGMAQGGQMNLFNLLDVPMAVILGVVLGAAAGLVLHAFFEAKHRKGQTIRNSVKVIIVLGAAFLLLAAEDWLKGTMAVSGLLAVMSMAMMLGMRSVPAVTQRLQQKYGKLWLAAEVILFVLVGAAVDVRYTLGAGAGVLVMILLGLLFRSLGVWLCMLGTNLTMKERLYCIIAYLPKATVQAAIGSVPLSLGLPCGKIVLSVSVIGILITAPLGAIGMDGSYRKLLGNEQL